MKGAPIQRRSFLALLGGAAAAWPRAAGAQQPAMPVIGYLSSGSQDTLQTPLAAFHRGLADSGYVAGQSVAIEYRWSQEQNDQLPILAVELVRRPVAVLVAAGGSPSALAAQAATKTIPIVFSIGGDPVGWGLVASLARPGGNITGVTSLANDVSAKRLQMLHELVPGAALIAVLINPTDARGMALQVRELQTAASVLGVRLLVLNAVSKSDIEAAFASLIAQRAGALVVNADNIFTTQRDLIVGLAARHAISAIYPFPEFIHAGGLMSYGSNRTEGYRVVGAYTGRILKGDKPADLPVQQATKIVLTINLKTARALGLSMPAALLVRADEVIE